jgi:HD domain-containing protein
MRLNDLPMPDTAATRAATEVLHRYAPPALVNHAIRSSHWAAAYGRLTGVEYDPELLHVAALLHDLGLEEPFDSHRLPFEVAGGHLAWVFGAGAGWDPARRERLGQVIVRHMWDDVDPALDPEGHLLERATSLDISGRGAGGWPADLRAEVLAAWPRLDLAARFTACFADQAARKPASSAAAAMRSGLADRIAANPLGAAGPDVREL